jgi:hypothetical protein
MAGTSSEAFWLVGTGVVLALGLAYALWANPASASGTTWPTTQFAPSASPVEVAPGTYAQLLDAGSDQVIVAHVTSVEGQVGSGTVVYAPATAPESYGDTVQFLLSSAINASPLAAALVT